MTIFIGAIAARLAQVTLGAGWWIWIIFAILTIIHEPPTRGEYDQRLDAMGAQLGKLGEILDHCKALYRSTY